MLSLNRLIQENTAEIQAKKLIVRIRTFAQQKHLDEVDIKNRIIWILRFIRFHNEQHPLNLNQSDIESFLSSLATEHNYDSAIQANAVIALNFLYLDFLKIKMSHFQYIKIKTRRGFIDLYGDVHCRAVLNHLQGTSLLMAELVVSGKLRLNEVINLKLTDINIKKNRISIRQNNGNIKFTLNIPIHLILDLRIQLMRVRQLVQIKAQQFSSIRQSQQDLLSHSQQGPTVKEDEYLFPVANIENPHISSRYMQLALLKNDIKIATRQHLRFSQETAVKIINPLNRRIIDKTLIDRTTTEKEFVLHITKSSHERQSSFSFPETVNRSENLELGAA